MSQRSDDLIPDFMQHERNYEHEQNRQSQKRELHATPPRKKGTPGFFHKHVLSIVVIVAILVLAILFGAVGSAVAKSSSSKKFSAASSELASKDQQISGLIADNESKDKKIQEYESKISSLEAALAAKQAGNGESGVKTCYLTFDDGPSENTLKILDTLQTYNVKATFFVIKNSKLPYIKQAYDAGHTIGLHTASHDYSIYSSSDTYFNDLNAISRAVESIIGNKSMIIRFPGGSSNTISRDFCSGIMTALTKQVTEKGYHYFDWNSDSGDASGNNVAVSTIMKNIRNGGTKARTMVVLMHDTDAKNTTVEALPQIIEFYSSNGYVFAPITENTPLVQHQVNN